MARDQSERGASLVEFALLLPLLVLLVFGIIDFGYWYNNSQSLRSGTRDGARQAAVGNFGSNSSCTLTGSLTGADIQTRQIMCLTKDRIGLGGSDIRTKVLVDSASPANTYAVGNPIVVCTQMQVKSITGFFSPLLNNRSITTKVQMRVESTNATAPTSAEEDAPSGGNWNFCSIS